MRLEDNVEFPSIRAAPAVRLHALRRPSRERVAGLARASGGRHGAMNFNGSGK